VKDRYQIEEVWKEKVMFEDLRFGFWGMYSGAVAVVFGFLFILLKSLPAVADDVMTVLFLCIAVSCGVFAFIRVYVLTRRRRGTRRNFIREIGVNPPSTSDWQAMHVTQQLVDASRAPLVWAVTHLQAQEKKLLVLRFPNPAEAIAALERGKTIRPQVVKAQKRLVEFDTMVRSFGFNLRSFNPRVA
jgi:hypothetical protein